MSGGSSDRRLTVPNVLSGVRLVGSAFLPLPAALDRGDWFVGAFIVLSLTDWLDGKLAIWLDQRSTFGARLDTGADLALYLSLSLGSWWLLGEEFLAVLPWGLSAAAAYLLSVTTCLARFGTWPSHHLRSAKLSWFLVGVGAVVFLLGWSHWPLRIALVGVTLASLEGVAVTLVLPAWHADVSSLFQALRERRRVQRAAGRPGR
jgi:CDP-diacylglycerol--glycerol-3-phosphate 3-phosphatidyltransferase